MHGTTPLWSTAREEDSRRSYLSLAITLVTLLVWPMDSYGAWVWEQVGPVNASEGLRAVTGDPSDPRIVWVGGSGRVWVTDDAGESFQLVLQIPGYGRAKRAAERAAKEEEETTNSDDAENTSDRLLQGGRGSVVTDTQTRKRRRESVNVVGRSRGGITRLRLVGNRLMVCTARGLWSVDRKARAVGTERREFSGRRDRVTDVATDGKGGLFIGTAKGLYRQELGRLASPVRGGLAYRPVTSLYSSLQGLVVATDRAVWLEKEGILSRVFSELGASTITDIARIGRVLTLVTAQKTWDLNPTTFQITAIRTLPNVLRVDQDAKGDVWLVGNSGAWRQRGATPFRTWRDGLTDPNLSDIYAPPAGQVRVWTVGRGGAFRLITEAERVASRRSRIFAKLGKDLPSVMETLERAQRAHHAHAENITETKRRQATAWLLPKVSLRYAPVRERITLSSLIPALGDYIIDEVRVFPLDDEFRVMATWELFPVLFPMLERGGTAVNSSIQTELKRIYRVQTRLRREVVPRYHAWIRNRALTSSTTPKTVRTAIKDILLSRQLEADLSVYTEGWFSSTPPGSNR